MALRTIADARVHNAVRQGVWSTSALPDGTTYRKMTAQGLYGRRKVTVLIRRTALPDASRGAVGRAMRALGLAGITRAKSIRTHDPVQGRDSGR
ncbi:hypothetical protein GCM10010407_02690 [Rarobacter incanus]